MMRCFFCGKSVSLEGKPERTEGCPHCHSDLHVCRNCRFYDPAAHNQCRETQAEWVGDREKANFCDFFEPSSGNSSDDENDSLSEARKKLDGLFGNS